MAARALELDVPAFRQREAECGNTSLKSVLWYLGRRVSAARLARLAHASTEGIEHAGLVTAARRAGASVFVRDHGSLAELRWFLARGLPAIVGWWSMEEDDRHFDPAWPLDQRRRLDRGHFSVVAGMDATRILLIDPQWPTTTGRPRVTGRRWMARSTFRRLWYDTDTPRYRRVERWYLVPHLSAERFAARIGGGADLEPLPDRR